MIKWLFKHRTGFQIALKNSVWLGIGNVFSRIIKFFLVVVAARVLGPEQYGAFYYTVYLFGLLFSFSDLGIFELFIREYQRKNFDPKILTATAFSLKTILTAASGIVAFGCFFFLKDPIVKTIFFILLVRWLVEYMQKFFKGLSIANNRMEYFSIAFLTESVVTTGIGLLFLLHYGTLVSYTWAYLFGTIASFGVLLILTRRYWIGAFSFDRACAVHMLKLSWPFVFSSALGGIVLTTDVVMIKWMDSAYSAGLYSAAYKIIQILLIIPSIFGTALFPFLSRHYKDNVKLAEMVGTTLHWLLMLGVPLWIGGVVLGPELIGQFFGDQYLGATLTFQILVFIIPLQYCIGLLNRTLLAIDYQVQNMVITGIGVGLNVTFNFILIQWVGLVGIAIGTVLAQSIDVALTYWFLSSKVRVSMVRVRPVFWYGLSGGLMGAAIIGLTSLQLNLFLKVGVGGLLYFLVLWVIQESEFISLIRRVESLRGAKR